MRAKYNIQSKASTPGGVCWKSSKGFAIFCERKFFFLSLRWGGGNKKQKLLLKLYNKIIKHDNIDRNTN